MLTVMERNSPMYSLFVATITKLSVVNAVYNIIIIIHCAICIS
jgi:hypothetical protein